MSLQSTKSEKSEVSAKKQEALTTIVSINGRDLDERDLDKAYKYREEVEGLVLDEATEKKLVRKIDVCLLPLIGLLMSCQLMDKTTNSYASIQGMREDLGFTGQAYSWVGTSFYLGYLVFQLVANRLLQRFPISKTLGIIVILWGIVLMCHAACQSSGPFLVCRVLLGCLESAMNPAYVLLTSQWYVRKPEDEVIGNNDASAKKRANQQFLRTTIWFGSQGFGTILGASIAYGLYIHTYSIASWRLLYVVTGIITIVLGIISIFHVPDVPVKAWFLNETEKKYVVARSKANQQGFGNTKLKKHQIIETFKDLKSYIFFIYGFSYALPNGGFTNFGSILYHDDLNFSTKQSLLMNMPGGAIDMLCPFLAIGLSYFLGNRLLVCSAVNCIGILGMALLAFTNPVGSRLFGIYTFYMATTSISGMLSYISSNVSGSTKKILSHWFFAIGYAAANAVAPFTFRANEAPQYTTAKVLMLVAFIVGLMCFLSIYFLDMFENKRRDKLRETLGEDYAKLPEGYGFADLTDKENLEFRYCP